MINISDRLPGKRENDEIAIDIILQSGKKLAIDTVLYSTIICIKEIISEEEGILVE